MARGLIGAGLISGTGRGFEKVSNVLGQGVHFVGVSMLQKQRQDAEMERLKVLEQYAGDREQRGYAHAEELQRRDLEHDATMQGQDLKHAEAMQERQQAFERGQAQEQFVRDELAKNLDVRRTEEAEERTRAKSLDKGRIREEAEAETERFKAGKETRKAHALEGAEFETAKAQILAENPAYLQAVEKLTRTKETPSQRADAAMKEFQLLQSKEAKAIQDEYVEAVKSGDQDRITKARTALEAHFRKPWEEEKVDAQMAALGLKEARTEIDWLSSLIKDAIPGTPEAQRLERNLRNAEEAFSAYNATLQRLTGSKVEKKPTGAVQINDPFKSSTTPSTMTADTPTGTEPAKGPAVSTDVAQELGGQKQRDEAIAGSFDSLSNLGSRIKEGATGLINRGMAALMPDPPAPTSGLISTPLASLPRRVSRPAPQARPQAQARPVPQERPAPHMRATERSESSKPDIYAAMEEVFAKDMKPADVFASQEFQGLPEYKQYRLRSFYEDYQQGKIRPEVFTNSVHALLDDTWGVIRAEMVARVLSRKG